MKNGNEDDKDTNFAVAAAEVHSSHCDFIRAAIDNNDN